MRQSIRHQSARYVMVGAVVYACDILVFLLVIAIDESMYLAGNIVGKIVGALVGFFLHKHVTFSWKQRDGTAQQFVSYMLTLGANIVLSSALLWFAVEQAGMYEPVAKLIVDVVTIVIAFVLSRWLVYRPS